MGPFVDLLALGGAIVSGSGLAAYWAASRSRAETEATVASIWRETLAALGEELSRSRADVAELREEHAQVSAALRDLLRWVDDGATPPPPEIDRSII